jgi:hypothetical protein
MSNLTATEQVRLRNLRLLHSKPGGAGGPTSDFLVHYLNEAGVSINKTELSNIYWEKKSISDHLAKSIENAFKLPSGWLSEDKEFIFNSPPGEVAAFRALASLPESLRAAIFQVIQAATEQQR